MSKLADSLLDKILMKVITWSEDNINRLIIGTEYMSDVQLPLTTRLEEHPIKGKRVLIRGRRRNKNTWLVAANWPRLGLNETNAPKLACILSGRVKFYLGNYVISCGAGHFFFIPSNLPHPDGSKNITDVAKSTFCQILYLLPHHNTLQCWISRYSDDMPPLQVEQNCLIQHEHAFNIFHAITDQFISNDIDDHQIGSDLLPIFFRIIAREVQYGHFQNIPHDAENYPISAISRKAKSFEEQLRQYIQTHLYERPTVESAARYFYYSRAQFSRYVRSETGKTFVEILNEHRIKTAKELLLESDWTIRNIAELIGYQSPHYFHVLFREQVGMTPSEYRRTPL